MPEVKNCLTCKWEPEWCEVSSEPLAPREGLHKGGYLYYGECRWPGDLVKPYGAVVTPPSIIRVGNDYVEIGWQKSDFAGCPAYEPAEVREGGKS